MCMYWDKKATTAFRKKIREAGGTITCWKVYERWRRWLSSVFYKTGSLSPGDILSNRERRAPTRDGKDYRIRRWNNETRWCISRGIHVFRTRSRAKQYCNRRQAVVVPVRCQLKDCVGAGDNGDAVFDKVHLSKRSFAAALRAENKP